MFNSQLLKDFCVPQRVMNAVAAGTSVQTSSAVNMAGADGCLFILLVGTLTATQVTALKAQQSDDDGSADDYDDLEGTLVGPLGDDDDNKMLVLDVFRPSKQYLKAVVNRATANAVIDGVIAIKYSVREAPITNDASVAFAEGHVTPDEGTA
jgi:hypothetical protein